MKRFNLLLIAASTLTIAACSTVDNMVDSISAIPTTVKTATVKPAGAEEFIIQGNCPKTEIVQELSGYSQFIPPEATTEDRLIARAHVTSIEGTCAASERSTTVDIKLAFRGVAGPQTTYTAGDAASYNFPFFVAITGPGGNILAKEVFSATMDFAPGDNILTYEETLRQIIPLTSPEMAKKHKILVGFQLDQQQLEYNRAILAQQQLLEEAAQNAAAQQNQISQQVQPAAPVTANDPIVIQRLSTTP